MEPTGLLEATVASDGVCGVEVKGNRVGAIVVLPTVSCTGGKVIRLPVGPFVGLDVLVSGARVEPALGCGPGALVVAPRFGCTGGFVIGEDDAVCDDWIGGLSTSASTSAAADGLSTKTMLLCEGGRGIPPC